MNDTCETNVFVFVRSVCVWVYSLCVFVCLWVCLREQIMIKHTCYVDSHWECQTRLPAAQT